MVACHTSTRSTAAEHEYRGPWLSGVGALCGTRLCCWVWRVVVRCRLGDGLCVAVFGHYGLPAAARPVALAPTALTQNKQTFQHLQTTSFLPLDTYRLPSAAPISVRSGASHQGTQHMLCKRRLGAVLQQQRDA